MCDKFIIILMLCHFFIIKPHYSSAKYNANSADINVIILKCSDETSRDYACVPQLIVNINYTPNLNVDSIVKLLLVDETYEPTKRKMLKIMSPYVIVISCIEPNTLNSTEGRRQDNRTEAPIITNLQIKGPNELRNAFAGTVTSNNDPLTEIETDINKCIKLNNENSNRSDIHVNQYIGDNRIRRVSRNNQNADFYQLLNEMKIPYASRVKRHKVARDEEHFDEYNLAGVQFRNLLHKNYNPLVYQLRRNKREKQHIMRKIRIRNTNEQMKPKENKLTNAPIQTNKKVAQSGNNVNGYCSASGLPTSDVDMKVYNHETNALPTHYIYNSSPLLQAKIKVFRKRRSTWWRITPIIEWVDILTPKNDFEIKVLNVLTYRLNNLSGTFVNGNFSVLLTSHNELLKKKFLKYTENGLKISNSVGILPMSSKFLSSLPNNSMDLNILDSRVPEYGIKIKMPFLENCAYQTKLKITLTRIITDAMTKDALQIYIEAINKGQESHEFSIGIANCPLSDFESTKTIVTKTLLPFISETITFLLPFIMASKKKIKFSCDVIVQSTAERHLIEMEFNNPSQKDKPIIAKRSMDVESHSRCFCIWNCRCHCIQKVETLNDVNVCHRMSYLAERDAGLLLNCPSSIDSEDVYPIDLNNDSCPNNPPDYNGVFGIIFIMLLVIILLVICSCKCFTPRKEDLLVASTEWICKPKVITSSQSNCDCETRKRSSTFVTDKPCRKQSQVDLESALITLTQHQKDVRKKSAKKNSVHF